MKTSNIQQGRAHPEAIIRGWVSSKRAGSSGITVRSGTTSVTDVTDVLYTGSTVTDDGSGGAIVSTNASSLILITMTPAQLTANTDDWDPVDATDSSITVANATIIRASTDATRNLTGIVGPGGTLILENVGAFDVVLKHNVTSTAANRFYCPNDVDFVVAKDSAVVVVYDETSSRWRVIQAIPKRAGGGTTKFLREDGAWVSPAGVVGGAAVGYALMATPANWHPALATPGANTISLPAVSGGNGGAVAIAIVVTSVMLFDTYELWQTATASARSCEIRLYLDNGTSSADFVTGTDATMSFTPVAAGYRNAACSGAPVSLQQGIYWIVIRNTSSSQTFQFGRSAGLTTTGLLGAASWREKSIAALGSTLDLSTSWTKATPNAGTNIILHGRALGEGSSS